MARRPHGNKEAKIDHKKSKLNDIFLRVHAKASTEMATALVSKAEIMRDVGALALFSMKPSYLQGEDAKKYVALRRKEELLKLKDIVQARELALAQLIVEQNKDKELDTCEGDECVELGMRVLGRVVRMLDSVWGMLGSVVSMLEWPIWLDMVCGRLHEVEMP